MRDLRTVWAAATGQAPPRELVMAKAGLTRRQRRAARRVVYRGQAADDVSTARLAVALARWMLRSHPSRWLVWLMALFVIGWVAFAVDAFADGHIVIGAVFAAATVMGLWSLNLMRPRYQRAARAAERLNREVLERAGAPYPEDPAAAPFQPPAPAIAAGAVALWAFYDLFFGALTDAIDGRSFDLGHATAHGAFYASLMTVVNLTVLRRRTKRQSQRRLS